MYKLVVKKSHGLHSIPLDISSSPWYFPSYAPYIVIALLFTIFLMFTLHPRGYFVTTNLYFLIPSPFSPSTNPCPLSFYFYFFKDLIYLFSERGEGRGKEGEKHRCERATSISCLLLTPNWGPGPQHKHVLRQGLKQWAFGSQAGAQSTEPHQPGLHFVLYISYGSHLRYHPRFDMQFY